MSKSEEVECGVEDEIGIEREGAKQMPRGGSTSDDLEGRSSRVHAVESVGGDTRYAAHDRTGSLVRYLNSSGEAG